MPETAQDRTLRESGSSRAVFSKRDVSDYAETGETPALQIEQRPLGARDFIDARSSSEFEDGDVRV